MAMSAEMLTALRELSNAKQLDNNELLDLLRDGIHAALMKKYGPNVRFELNIDQLAGTMSVMRLRQVVESVEDAGAEVSLEEARFEDPEFQVGDVLEEEVPFEAFGRLAVQAAKQRIIQRVREGERNRIRDEFAHKVGELLSGEIQQVERGKFVILLNRFREAEAEYARWNFDVADTDMLLRHFDDAEAECARILNQPADDPKTGRRIVMALPIAPFIPSLSVGIGITMSITMW